MSVTDEKKFTSAQGASDGVFASNDAGELQDTGEARRASSEIHCSLIDKRKAQRLAEVRPQPNAASTSCVDATRPIRGKMRSTAKAWSDAAKLAIASSTSIRWYACS